MNTDSNYGPSTRDWVREQVEEYEASGGTRANTLRETGLPIILMTTIGHKSQKIRKVPLMRVEHGGEERKKWWARAVEAFPTYEEYRAKTDREIPVFVARPKT